MDGRVEQPDGVMPEWPTDEIFLETKGNDPNAEIVLASFMIALALSVVALRFYARSIRRAPLLADDWTLLGALIFTLGNGVCILVGATYGGLHQHEPIDMTTNYPVRTQKLRTTLQVSYACLLTGMAAIGLTKISVLLMYRRILNNYNQNKALVIVIWTLIVLSSIWTVAFFFGAMFQCKNPKWNWYAYGGTAPEQCIIEDPMYAAQAYSSAILDACILVVPIPSILALRMPLAQKLAVLGMFLLGAITLALSILRAVVWSRLFTQLEAYNNDLTWIFTPALDLLLVEATVGLCGACMPLLKPVFDGDGKLKRLISSFTSSRLWTSKASQATGELSDIGGLASTHDDIEKDAIMGGDDVRHGDIKVDTTRVVETVV